MGEGRHCNPGWLLSALLLRPPSRPRSPVRCGRREPEGSGLATLRRFREGRGRPRGCRTGPWPGRREWRAGWAASSWCQVRSAGRGPERAGWQAWELGGGASPSLGPWVPRKGPCTAPSTGKGTPRHGPVHTRGVALPLARSWEDHSRASPPPSSQRVPGCLDGKLKRGAGTVLTAPPSRNSNWNQIF